MSDYSPRPKIKVGGNDLPPELDAMMDLVEVETDLVLPGTFSIRFRDPRHDVPDAEPTGSGSMLQRHGLEIGKEVDISVAPVGSTSPQPLLKGEVTTIEGSYDEEDAFILVCGYDKRHRLHRGRKGETKENPSDSSLMQDAASGVGFSGTAQGNTTHKHFPIHDLTAFELVQARARSNDLVVADDQGSLSVAAPTEASSAPAAGGEPGTNPKVLSFGVNLLSFTPRLTAPQHAEVEVRGWDHVARVERMAKKPVTSKGAQLPTDPATLAKKFGTPTYLYPTPIAEQGEVDTLATALAEHIGSTFAEAEATAKGNPALTAGAAVSVDRVSAEFAGKWVISSARHVFDGVYRTHLRMSGRLERSLLGLTSLPSLNGNGGGRGALDAGGPIYGVMIGKVVDLNDPEKLGRVKVELPWMGPNYKTDWAWMVERGAGEDRGEWIPPEVGDTVVVAYEQGDPRFPFVIGNVYNGQAKPFQKDGPAVDGGQVKWRGFASKTGHRMVFRDESGKEHIEIKTGDDKFFIKLDQAGTTIEVNSNGKVVIKGAQDIEIESQANIKMKASQAVNIEAGTDLNLKGGVNANLEGSAQVNVKASGPASVKGNPVQLN